MRKRPANLSLAPALAFAAAASAALLLGWPTAGGVGWVERARTLGETRNSLAANAVLHRPFAPPPFPEPASFCRQCHPLPPHPGRSVAAAFLNQHSTSFDCLVCHWSRASGPQPDLAWDRRRGAEEPDPEAGDKKLVLRTTEPLEGGRRGPADLRRELVAHQTCFDRGPGCLDCHRQGAMFDYLRPGMTEGEEKGLESLPEFTVLPPGVKWYFPQRSP